MTRTPVDSKLNPTQPSLESEKTKELALAMGGAKNTLSRFLEQTPETGTTSTSNTAKGNKDNSEARYFETVSSVKRIATYIDNAGGPQNITKARFSAESTLKKKTKKFASMHRSVVDESTVFFEQIVYDSYLKDAPEDFNGKVGPTVPERIHDFLDASTSFHEAVKVIDEINSRQKVQDFLNSYLEGDYQGQPEQFSSAADQLVLDIITVVSDNSEKLTVFWEKMHEVLPTMIKRARSYGSRAANASDKKRADDIDYLDGQH